MDGNFLGGLNGLMKGLSGIMPQDNPETKLMTTQSEINDLKKKEVELYAEIGKVACSKYPGAFADLENQLKLVQSSLDTEQKKLDDIKAEKEKADQAQRTIEEDALCPSCGYRNPEGVKFCQECGTKLGVKKFCPNCGELLAPGTKFCGGCGSRVD